MPNRESDDASSSALDVSIVASLAEIAARHDLSEVEVEHNGLRIRVGRARHAAPVVHTIASAPAPLAPAPVAAAPVAPEGREGAVISPMVGTAYLRASPESRPFVEIGAMVKVGDKLMLVEAMKTYNEIVAERAGKVVEIFVQDGSPVEYGQPLMVIE
ncbi:MAG: acetyl-CoA carboxylase biotin carboxyl carrier protein [Pseudomonadota bacterium]|nr:acetyl-CoA carboxylase biotin carboxyl carrier protein [Pseudomonadota bacterium]